MFTVENHKLSEVEVAIIRRLSKREMSGSMLISALNIDPLDFQRVHEKLWRDYFLKGRLEDGCCSAPCGPDCVSAFKSHRVWLLTKKGKLLARTVD